MATSHDLLSATQHQALLSAEWFASMPEPVRDDVIARAHLRALAPGERLFSYGDASDGMYGVLEGVLRLSSISRDGRETVLDFYRPGAWVGEVSVLDGLPRIQDADASGSTLVLQLKPEDVESLLAAHPAFSRALLRLAARRLRILLTALQTYSSASLERRLAERLLLLEATHGMPTSTGVQIGLRLTQETLAQLVGATRQRVNQLIRTWEREGVVAQRYGRIVVLDDVRLRELADT